MFGLFTWLLIGPESKQLSWYDYSNITKVQVPLSYCLCELFILLPNSHFYQESVKHSVERTENFSAAERLECFVLLSNWSHLPCTCRPPQLPWCFYNSLAQRSKDQTLSWHQSWALFYQSHLKCASCMSRVRVENFVHLLVFHKTASMSPLLCNSLCSFHLFLKFYKFMKSGRDGRTKTE